jgi:hypothetical protein
MTLFICSQLINNQRHQYLILIVIIGIVHLYSYPVIGNVVDGYKVSIKATILPMASFIFIRGYLLRIIYYNYNNMTTKLTRVIVTSLFATVFTVGAGFINTNSALADSTALGVTQITAIANGSGTVGYATADNTYADGWRWDFYVTVPNNQTLLKMKFADWISGSNIIPAGGNIQIYSAQSTNAMDESHAIPITASSTWGDIMNLNPNVDEDVSMGGRQIDIIVEAKIPTGSAGGSYSTSYGINTTATSSISFDGLTQTYNGTPEAVSITTTPANLPTTITYSGTNYTSTTTAPTHVGTYTVNAVITDPGFTGTSTATLTINPESIAVVANPQSKVYDGATSTDPLLTYTVTPSIYSGDSFTGTTTRVQGENAGSYAITQGTLALDGDYALTFSPNNFVITQAPATVTLGNLEQTYDKTEKSVSATTSPVGLSTSVTYDGLATLPVNAGTHIVVATITDPNYTGSTTENLVIDPASLTVTAITSTKVYDASTTSDGVPTITSGTIFTGDTAPTWTQTFDTKDIGTEKTLTATGTVADGNNGNNYHVTFGTATGSITPATAVVSATGQNKVYDGTTDASTTLSVSGNVGGDILTAVDTAKFVSKDVADNIEVDVTGITISGAPAGDYLYNTTASTTANITPASLSITANDASKTYGTTTVFAGTEFTSTGLASTDTISSVTLTSDGVASTSAVGTYSITPSAPLGIILSNYKTPTYTNGTLTVDKATLTIKADNFTRAYGEQNPIFTGTITGIQNEDPISAIYSTIADASSSVGAYAITPSTSSDTHNYDVTLTNGTLTINQAAQAIVGFSAITDKTYGDADFGVSATGGASGNPVTFSTPSTGICSVTGNTVHIISGGDCTITASQAGDDNYDAAPDVSQSFHITAANLILTVSSTTATIAQSDHLISEGTYGNADNNSDLDSLVSGGLQPIAVRLQNIGDAASAKVRISPINAGTHIQFWAKDTSGNWYDINVSGWIDTAGISIPPSYNASTDIYVISDTVGSYNLTVNLVDAANPATIVASTTGTVTVKDMTPPTLSILGFTENGSPMNGSLANGYTLNTDNNPNTHYTIQFAPGSIASENLKVENVALTLIPTDGQTAVLQTFYSTYPTQYQTYLDAAAAGTQPFAFIKTDGTTAIKILDGAQEYLAQTESDMIVPGNYPLGTYTVKGTIHDIAGNSTDMTFALIVAGDRIPPVGGQLTMVTKLHPNGIVIASSTGGVYSLPPLSLDGADVFQSMSVVVTDETSMNTTSVPVYVDGTENGQMVYSGSGNIWNYENQTSQPNFSSGTHSFVATFLDDAGNKTTLTATFTTDNTPPTATVDQSGTTGGGTITYTFSEPVQLTSNDSLTIYPESEIASKLAVYAVTGSDYTTASQVAGVTITGATVSDNTWILTYIGNLVAQTNTKYIVDAWGYKITDLAGNQMLPTDSAMFTVLSPSQLITIGDNINGSIGVDTGTYSSPKFEITADSNYYISDVLVDGTSVIGNGGFAWENASTTASYTFTNVVSAHTLSAVFTANQ